MERADGMASSGGGGADSLRASAFIPVCTAACLLVGSTSLFFVFTCPWVASTICPAVPPCCAVLFLFVLANFTMATFTDAGVLPTADDDEDKDDEFRAPLYKNVDVRGVQVRMKWCASCHFYRPPRCSHCSVCDRCVEVTGKFQGGVNPYTRGCCNNLEYLVCSPFSPRYSARPRKKSVIHIRPPFLRPEPDRQPSVKVSDNGKHSRASAGPEPQKSPPPLPPKPDRGLLKSHLAAMEDMGHHAKCIIPVSIPTVPQLRPVLEAISRGSSPIPPEQLLKTCEPPGDSKSPDLRLETNGSPSRAALPPSLSPLQAATLTLSSRSLSLKHGGRHVSAKSQGNHGGGSSYDTLVATADPQCRPHRGPPPVGYFMSLGPDAGAAQRGPHAYSPVFVGVARHSPQPRDPSPSPQGLPSRDPSSPSFLGFIQREPLASLQDLLSRELSPAQSLRDGPRDASLTPPGASTRFDGLPKALAASVHERREMEETERTLRLHARSQALYGPDACVYDIPCRRSLPPDPGRPQGIRGPTPPAYGSREFLMSTGVLGYGPRTSPLSSSSLARGLKPRSSSPGYCQSERPPVPPSTCTLPRLPSCSTASSTPPYALYGTTQRSSLKDS
ncbi:palmitoyltransferase ZDHHC8B isoform X2 [Syngnathoides biaculeatus]|uniref:palmitoyltransferase ZDHHC8B isoform X2 n=1 Tax=Syngnathoides biaculeatus TaxID=300417 RepID=UPI002ADE7E28|nr:palmitoyltransferase ZDHHC8B isoform X2 [Syngnathoides biaculeatus]